MGERPPGSSVDRGEARNDRRSRSTPGERGENSESSGKSKYAGSVAVSECAHRAQGVLVDSRLGKPGEGDAAARAPGIDQPATRRRQPTGAEDDGGGRFAGSGARISAPHGGFEALRADASHLGALSASHQRRYRTV